MLRRKSFAPRDEQWDVSREGHRRVQPSRVELVLEPLTRARDLLRVLSNAIGDAKPAAQKTIDAALRASEHMLHASAGVESDIGRRSFTRELYRAWATILEVREIVADDALIRVLNEVEDSLESVRRTLRHF